MGIIDKICLFESNDGELKLYVDLDGVLTDFQQAWFNLDVSDINATDYEDKFGTCAFWKHINAASVEFWSEMPWTEDGKQLWNYIKKFKPTVLTTPAKSKASKIGKEIWIKRELGNVPFIFEKNKYKYATLESVLIDDYDTKIIPWVENDGIGIHHKDTKSTIEYLKRIGL